MSNLSCPDQQSLDQLVQGELAENQRTELTEHLLHCERCAALVSTIRGSDEITAAIRLKVSQSNAPSALEQSSDIAISAKPSDSIAEDTAPAEDISFLGPAEADDEIGRLGGYRILQVLGAGGMGVVFKAEDPNLQRLVALKVMKPSIAANPAAKERFLREARATASIEHHHIVQIYQVGEDRQIPFIAMQFLQGESLQTRLTRENNLPQSEVLRIGREVAAGLAAAHGHGLIHRDIKPDNVWLDTKSGWAKILDFGLVRAATDDAGLTNSGMILGTPRYMAPEQAQGETVDHRSDLFSLGSMLYRLASGEFAFAGNNLVSTLISVVKANPKPIHEVAPELHPELAQSIMKLLEKDPPSRPQTAAEVEAEFARIEKLLATASQSIEICTLDSMAEQTGAKPATAAASRDRGHRHWVIGAGFAALLILSAILFRFKTDDGTVVVELDGTIEIAAVEIDKHKVSFTPDASKKQLTFQVDPGKHSITITTADGFELVTSLGEKPLEIKTGDTAKLRAWLEPNTRELTAQAAGMKPNVERPEPKPAASAVRSLDMAPAASAAVGSPNEQPAYDPSPLPMLGTWEPFGTADQTDWSTISNTEILPGLALQPAQLSGLRRWNVETRRPRGGTNFSRFSPDGMYVAIISNNNQTRIYDAKTSALVQCLPGTGTGNFSNCLDWHPNGEAILVVCGAAGWATLWTFSDERLPEAHPIPLMQNARAARFSPDGQQLVTIHDGEVNLWDVDGKKSKTITESQLSILHDHRCSQCVDWSPDSQSFAIQSSTGELWIWDREGVRKNVIPSPPDSKNDVAAFRVQWSSDGDWIYTHDPSDRTQVLRVSPDGNYGAPIKVSEGGQAIHFRCSSNGKRVYASGHGFMSVTDVETGEIRAIGFETAGEGFDISGDGSRVVSGGGDRFTTLDADLNELFNSPNSGSDYCLVEWNPHGSQIVACGSTPVLWSFDGHATLIRGDNPRKANHAAWHPDGSSLALNVIYNRNLQFGDPTQEMKTIESDNYHCLSWSGDGAYVAGGVREDKRIDIYNSVGTIIKRIRCDANPWIAFRPTNDLLAVCIDNVLYTCTAEDDWQLHEKFKLKRELGWDGLVWSRDGKFLALRDSCLLSFKENEFTVVHESDSLVNYQLDLSPDGTRFATAGGHYIEVADSKTGNAMSRWFHNGIYCRAFDWHPSRELFTTGFDDCTFVHWDAQKFEPYWRGVQLPGNQSVAITAAGQILAGDRSVVDEHLIYYIETDEGQIKMLTPTEFETLIGESIYVPQSR